MKPPPFAYEAPETLDETLALLAEYGDEAKVLAGGQSLVPLLNFRLVHPQLLIDINRIRELKTLSVGDDGILIGAGVRQREIERYPDVSRYHPLLAETMPLIGHFQIRNRGTVCGSLAHADPAAELPAVALASDAEFILASRRGERRLGADDFFITYLTTALEPFELLRAVWFPRWRYSDGWSIQEFARRHGDFALAGVVVRLRKEGDRCTDVRIVTFGVSGRPQRSEPAETVVRNSPVDDRTIEEAVAVLRQTVEAEGDPRAGAAYRRYLAGTLLDRALRQARERVGPQA